LPVEKLWIFQATKAGQRSFLTVSVTVIRTIY